MNARKSPMRWPALLTATTLALFLVALAILASPTGAEPPALRATAEDVQTSRAGPGAAPAADPLVGYKGPFGFGRDATPEEIAAWDIDIRPDGTGLPAGSGTVEQGAAIFALKCAPCHGPTGKEGPNDVLVRPFDSSAPWPQFPRTIGNYWPYATTAYDFINRAMPFSSPNSLEDEEVYALVAWLLNQNGLIPEDAVMNAETLPQVQMPALRFFRPAPSPSYRLE